MPITPQLIGYVSAGFIALAIGAFVYWLASHAASARPEMGVKGLKRRKALEEGGVFGLLEPMVRWIASAVAHVPVADLRARAAEQLMHAGDYLGLTADEYLALSVISVTFTTAFVIGTEMVAPGTLNPMLSVLIVALGLVLPYLQVQGEVERRFKQINRGLPYAIDLASLAMGAGLDFPGALRQVTDKSPDKSDALFEELTRILNEIDLGRTRKQALEGFAERAPTESVRDFVFAVIQSEEKGNPLADVLVIQATSLRMRRTVAAEEAAARAGLMLMGPLMMIFMCIMLILMGPFIVTSMSGNGF